MRTAGLLSGAPPESLARQFRAFGDPTRIALLARLAEARRSVGDLVRDLQVPQPAVSHHLRILRDAGLVRDERTAGRVVYRLAPGAGAELVAVLTALTAASGGEDVPAPGAVAGSTEALPAGAADPALFVD